MSLDVLIVDDQTFCFDQLTLVVRERSPTAVLRIASNLEAALAELDRRSADLTIVEYSLPDLGGEAGIRRICEASPGAVLVLDARHDPVVARACMAAGARGYVTRSSSRDLVSAAIAVVIAGGRYFPGDPSDAAPWSQVQLSSRQREVLEGVMRGQTNQEIGERLGIALPTVKLHVRSILRALGARNRTEAALLGKSMAPRV